MSLDVATNSMNRLVQCYKQKFPLANIFVVKKPIPVYWGHISVLEADMFTRTT